MQQLREGPSARTVPDGEPAGVPVGPVRGVPAVCGSGVLPSAQAGLQDPGQGKVPAGVRASLLVQAVYFTQRHQSLILK